MNLFTIKREFMEFSITTVTRSYETIRTRDDAMNSRQMLFSMMIIAMKRAMVSI